MAQMRSPLARGLAAAFGSGADSLDKMIERKAQAEMYQRQQDAMLERQKQLADHNAKIQERENEKQRMEAAATKALADRQNTMQGLFGEVAKPGDDPGALPSAESLLSRAELVGESDPAYPGAGTVLDLPGRGPTTITAHPMRDGSSKIEELLKAGEVAREQAIQNKRRADAQRVGEIPHIGPDGIEGFKGPDGSFIPTERDPITEAGRQAALIEMTTPGKVDLAVQTAKGTAPYSPVYIPGMGPNGPTTYEQTPGGTPRDLGTGSRSTAANPTGGDAKANALATRLDRFATLVEHVNTESGPGQLMKGGVGWMKGAARLDPLAEEYGRMVEPLGLELAVYTQGSRPTDKDAEIMARSLPSWTTTKPVARQLLAMAKKAMEGAVAANRAVGLDLPNMTIEQIEQAKRDGRFVTTMSAAQLAALLASAGGGEPVDPNNTILDNLDQLGQ